jgi:hypothetical protein
MGPFLVRCAVIVAILLTCNGVLAGALESKEVRELRLQRELLAWVEAYGIGTHKIAIKHRDDIGRWMVAAEARSSE